MNKKFISAVALTIVTSLGVYIFGSAASNKVYAYGGENNNRSNGVRLGFQDKANLFGLSIEELNRLKASGKTMLEIAKERGMTEEAFHLKVQELAVARWKAKGFTDQEIQTRLTQMKERQETCDGTPKNFGLMNQGRGFNRN